MKLRQPLPAIRKPKCQPVLVIGPVFENAVLLKLAALFSKFAQEYEIQFSQQRDDDTTTLIQPTRAYIRHGGDQAYYRIMVRPGSRSHPGQIQLALMT